MALATLSIDLETKLAKMEQGFDRAGRLSEKFAADQERRFAAIKNGATAIGAAIAGAFSVVALQQWFATTVNGLDALNDLKDATGASIENISALEDVAARTGTSFEAMSTTLVKFNKVLGDSKAGSETANILKAIGLNAEELKESDPAEALRKTAVALAGFADDGNKARIVQELFGKSVQEVAPFLKDLAEQGQLNAKVTTEQAQAAEDFNKQLFQLKKNSEDNARALVSDLIPALNTFFDRLKGIKQAGGLSAFFGSIGDEARAQGLRVEIEETVREIELLQNRLDNGGGSEYDNKGLRRRIEALRKQFADLQSQAAATNAALLGFADKAKPLPADYSNEGRTRARPALGSLPDADKKGKQSEIEKYIEQLEKATLASLELSKEDEARIAIASGELGKLTEAQKDYVILLARGIDLAKKKEPNFVDTSALDEAIDLQREMNSLLQTIPTAKLEKQKKLQDALKFAFEQGTISVQQYHEALGELIPITEKLADETNSFAKEAAANIQDELGNTLEDALSGSFDNIGKNWERLLVRMAAQAAAAKLNQELFGSDYGKTGQIGGLIGSLFGSGSGGSGYPTIGGGAGDSSGYITPSAGPSSARGGRQSVTNNYVYNVAAGVTRNELITALQASHQAQRAETTQRLQRAGVT